MAPVACMFFFASPTRIHRKVFMMFFYCPPTVLALDWTVEFAVCLSTCFSDKTNPVSMMGTTKRHSSGQVHLSFDGRACPIEAQSSFCSGLRQQDVSLPSENKPAAFSLQKAGMNLPFVESLRLASGLPSQIVWGHCTCQSRTQFFTMHHQQWKPPWMLWVSYRTNALALGGSWCMVQKHGVRCCTIWWTTCWSQMPSTDALCPWQFMHARMPRQRR